MRVTGMPGAILITVCILPQVVTVVRSKDVAEVSVTAAAQASVSCAAWAIYALVVEFHHAAASSASPASSTGRRARSGSVTTRHSPWAYRANARLPRPRGAAGLSGPARSRRVPGRRRPRTAARFLDASSRSGTAPRRGDRAAPHGPSAAPGGEPPSEVVRRVFEPPAAVLGERWTGRAFHGLGEGPRVSVGQPLTGEGPQRAQQPVATGADPRGGGGPDDQGAFGQPREVVGRPGA